MDSGEIPQTPSDQFIVKPKHPPRITRRPFDNIVEQPQRQLNEKLIARRKKKSRKLTPRPDYKAWLKSLPKPPKKTTQQPTIFKPKTIQQKYEILDELFGGFVFAIRFLQLTETPQTFKNIKPVSDQMSHRRLTHSHLGQFKFILPEVVEIDKVLIWDDWTSCLKADLQMNLNLGILYNDDGNQQPMKSIDNDAKIQLRKLFQERLKSFYVSHPEAVDVPTPDVSIDPYSNPDATILQVSFGGSLGALIETINGLKHFGLDVTRRTITAEEPVTVTRVLVTQISTGRKVEDQNLLENVRLTIISNLLKYSQVSEMGEAFVMQAPLKKPDAVDIANRIHVEDDGPKRSLLRIETEDRPGLLLEVIKMMADVNITVESAEIDTQGLVPQEMFHVSHRGEALDYFMSQVLTSHLCYCLGK